MAGNKHAVITNMAVESAFDNFITSIVFSAFSRLVEGLTTLRPGIDRVDQSQLRIVSFGNVAGSQAILPAAENLGAGPPVTAGNRCGH
jgi:hypothetical protein